MRRLLGRNQPVFYGARQLAEALDGGWDLEGRVLCRKFGSGRFLGCGFSILGTGCREFRLDGGSGSRLGAEGGEAFQHLDRLIEDLAELPSRAVSEGFERGQSSRV